MYKWFYTRAAVKAADDTTGTIEGYASIFGNTDQQNEVVMAGAFKRTLEHWKTASRPIPLLWHHDPKNPVGYITECSEDERGLRYKAQLLLDTEEGRRAYACAKAGMLGNSFNARVIREQMDYATKTNQLQELALREISLATNPANIEAGVTAVKAHEIVAQVNVDPAAVLGTLLLKALGASTSPALPADAEPAMAPAPSTRVKALLADAVPDMPADERLKGMLAQEVVRQQFETQVSQVEDEAWRLHYAFRRVTREIVEDEETTPDDKRAALKAAVSEYGTLLDAWMEKWIALQAQIVAATQVTGTPASKAEDSALTTPPTPDAPAPAATQPVTEKADAPCGLTPLTIPSGLDTLGYISPEDTQALLQAFIIPTDEIAKWDGVDLEAVRKSQHTVEIALTEASQHHEVREMFRPLNDLTQM